MGTSFAAFVPDLFLFCSESDYMASLSDGKQVEIIEAFSSAYSCPDELSDITSFTLKAF